jgi:hypothetical protein
MRRKFWSENLKERDHSKNPGSIDGKIILEWILWKWGGKVWTVCIWFRIGISDGLLMNTMNIRFP